MSADFGKPLSERQREIIQRVAQGKRNAEIAEELGLRVGTVKDYLTAIYAQLRLRNRTELALWLIQPLSRQ